MPGSKAWWSRLAFGPGGTADATGAPADADSQYWWLLPGDLSRSAAQPGKSKTD